VSARASSPCALVVSSGPSGLGEPPVPLASPVLILLSEPVLPSEPILPPVLVALSTALIPPEPCPTSRLVEPSGAVAPPEPRPTSRLMAPSRAAAPPDPIAPSSLKPPVPNDADPESSVPPVPVAPPLPVPEAFVKFKPSLFTWQFAEAASASARKNHVVLFIAEPARSSVRSVAFSLGTVNARPNVDTLRSVMPWTKEIHQLSRSVGDDVRVSRPEPQ